MPSLVHIPKPQRCWEHERHQNVFPIPPIYDTWMHWLLPSCDWTFHDIRGYKVNKVAGIVKSIAIRTRDDNWHSTKCLQEESYQKRTRKINQKSVVLFYHIKVSSFSLLASESEELNYKNTSNHNSGAEQRAHAWRATLPSLQTNDHFLQTISKSQASDQNFWA